MRGVFLKSEKLKKKTQNEKLCISQSLPFSQDIIVFLGLAASFNDSSVFLSPRFNSFLTLVSTRDAVIT